MDNIKIYQQRKEDFQNEALKKAKLTNLLSIFRVTVFIIGMIIIIYFANEGLFTPLVLVFLITAIIFIWLVKYYNRVSFWRNHASYLSQINDDFIKKTRVELKEFDGGDEFADSRHGYINDLDVFGKNSLFQLVNFTTTASGREKLALNLKGPFTAEEVKNYQLSCQELVSDLEWMQEFHALGLHYREKKNYNQSFFDWINSENLINNKALNLIVSNLFTLLAIAALFSWLFFDLSFSYLLLVLLINSVIIFTHHHKLKETTEKTDDSGKALAAYELLIEKLETSNFTSSRLRHLQEQLVNPEIKASRAIKKLKNIIFLYQN